MKKALLVAALLIFTLCATISASADERYGDYSYSIDDEGAHITCYYGTDTIIVIPEEIEGIPVVSVSFNGIWDNDKTNYKSISRIDLPSSVKRIEEFGFSGLTSLRELNGTENIVSIGDYALLSTALEEAVFSDALEYIGKNAFGGNGNLQRLTIPDDVVCAESPLFSSQLKKITLTEGSGEKRLKLDGNALLSYDGTRLISYPQYCGNMCYTVPDSVLTIDDDAFTYPGLALYEITIPATVEKIGRIHPVGNLTLYVYPSSPGYDFAVSMAREYSIEYFNYIVMNEGDEIVNLDAMVETIVEENTSPDMSVWEKAKSLHDWLILTVDYDYTYQHSTAPYMLKNHTGVCAAYAETYALLLNKAGISVKVVGNFDHAFDAVKLENGEWMYVDCTWDDMGSSGIQYEYFGFERMMRMNVYGGMSDPSVQIGTSETSHNDSSGKNHYYYRIGQCNALIEALETEICSCLLLDESQFFIPIDDLIENYQLSYDDISDTLCFISAAVASQDEWDGITSLFCNFTRNDDGVSGFMCCGLTESLSECDDYIFDIYNSKMRILYYRGKESNVVVPESIYGIEVAYIGNASFKENAYIRSITLPSTIKSIQSNAFSDCVGLQSVNFPEGLEVIGDYSFKNCYMLKGKLQFPETLTRIDYCAFDHCTRISEVYIPASCKTLSSSVFSNCKSLETAIMSDGVEYLGSGVFSECDMLHDVRLSPTIYSIGHSVFFRCYALENIELPASLQWLGNSVFSECYNLSSITISNENLYFSIHENIIYSADGKTLIQCLQNNNVKEICIREGVETIRGYAFAYNTSIEYVWIPSSVRTIEQYAFSDCLNLKEVYMEDGCISLGQYCFTSCRSLSSLRLSQCIVEIGRLTFFGVNPTISIELPYGLQSIEDSTFTGAQQVVIPNTVSFIDNNAFRVDETLLVVGRDSYALNWALENGYTEIGSEGKRHYEIAADWKATEYIWSKDNSTVTAKRVGFYNPDIIESEEVPVTVQIISPMENDAGQAIYTSERFENEAFAIQIKTVTIQALKDLSVMYLPQNLHAIHDESFTGIDCQAVIIPYGCISIGNRAFANCVDLVYVYIPASVTSIADDAFENCLNVIIDRTDTSVYSGE